MQRKPMCAVEVSTICGLPGGRSVAQAVVRRAEVRASLDHAPWDRARRAVRARSLSSGESTRGLLRDAAGVLGLVGMTRRVEVGRPLPDVAGHVVEPVAVGREAARPVRCPRSRRAPGSARGTRPARCSPSSCRSGCARLPRRRRRPRGRRAPRTPTPPRSEAPCRPRRRRRPRPRRRRARPGGARGRRSSCPALRGAQSRPGRMPTSCGSRRGRPVRSSAEDERPGDEQLGSASG